jgi:hypothetical protein
VTPNADYEGIARAELAGDPKQEGLSIHARTCPEPWCVEYIKVYDRLAPIGRSET